jgi:hypothetical protein
MNPADPIAEKVESLLWHQARLGKHDSQSQPMEKAKESPQVPTVNLCRPMAKATR